MRVIVYLPFVLSALVAILGPRMASRMPPRTGTRLLLAAAAGSAATMLLTLSLLAWTLIAPLPLVAAVGAWSGDHLHHDDPVPAQAAKAACVILALLACTVTVAAARRLRALHHVRQEGRQLGNGRLVVIDQPDLEAFAIPTGDEHHGRIVVSTGMLRTLTPDECRVLLAHEAAHLDHAHHRYRTLATLITAANPILLTLPAAIHHLTERWADEAAAATTDDRHLTARALARAALAAHEAKRRPSPGGAVLCFGQTGVGNRVRALLADTPPRRPATATLLIALLAASLLSSAEAGRDSAQLLTQARDHYHARPVRISVAVRHEARHLLAVVDHRLHH
ncbi:MAG TPA: M48 family metalloprotease [Actinoallomurus sp.]|nr:M48 family metalloprotease [Actinoallomurus sp.]